MRMISGLEWERSKIGFGEETTKQIVLMKTRKGTLILLSTMACIFCASLIIQGGANEPATSTGTSQPTLQIKRSENPDEVLLTLTGAAPKKYYILFKAASDSAAWSIETTIDASVETATAIPMKGLPQALFKVVAADEYDPLTALVAGTGSADDSTKTPAGKTGAKGSREWFVNRKTGHDSLDGRSKQRSANSGPLATIKKAMTLSQAGDSVIIADGSYAEDLNLSGKNVSVKLDGNVILH